MDDICFSEQLREARQRAGITQKLAAVVLKISFETYSKWERGKLFPHVLMQEGALARLRSWDDTRELA